MFHTGLHDQYHRPSDDVEWINSAGLGTVAQLVFGTFIEAAEAPLDGFRSVAQQEGEAARRTFERPLPSPPPRLGISWRTTPNEPKALRVTSVRFGSPADRAGIRTGDIIQRFAGQAITDTTSLQQAVVRAPRDVTMEVERDTDSLSLAVSLDGSPSRLGLSWRTNSAEPGTVTVIRVIRHSPADRAGLQLADRIHQIGGRTFPDSRAFADLAHSLPLPLDLLIERNGQFQSLSLPKDSPELPAPDEEPAPSSVDQEPSDSVAPDATPESESSVGNPELR
jgi:C-terminal processing protease CtpA/Prc